MSYNINIETLKKVFPSTHTDNLKPFVEPLNKVFKMFNLDKMSAASFLAQVGHETGEFKVFEENLNYSEQGLLKTFKKYFTPAQAKQYAKNPVKIASRVYGNGDEASQDGWKYRGRGAIQVTFKDNYEDLAKWLDYGLEDTIVFLKTPGGAIESAAWYFDSKSLWDEAKSGDLMNLTKKINGGLNGYDHRKKLFERAKLVL